MNPRHRYIIGIIGAGNMGEALIRGLLRSQLVRPYELIASAHKRKRLVYLEKTYGIHTTLDNKEIAEGVETIIIAVKPQNMDELFERLKGGLSDNHLIISIAAGISIARLRSGLGRHPRLIRVMPNLPSLIDEGVSAIYAGKTVPERDKRFAHQIFQAVGETVDINDESLMDVITGLSGTGPAYLFALVEALRDAGIKLGLSPKLANSLTLTTMSGASRMALTTGETPEELRERVTSKRGTTWAAMKVFKKRRFWKLIGDAVRAATRRSRELSKR